MGKRSMEEEILRLFFEQPTKHWHFKEVKEAVPIADNKVSRWLKVFEKQVLIKRIKPRKRMPYYISNYENPEYKNKKRVFALKRFYETGFLNHLSTLKNARTVILFGSFTRWDWHKDSDIDLFIYGNDSELEQGKYELLLSKEIQVFSCKNQSELKKFDKGLMRSIIKGDLIKGDIDFIEVKASA